MREAGLPHGPGQDRPGAAAVVVFQPNRIDPGFASGPGPMTFGERLLSCTVETLDRCPEIQGFLLVAPDALEQEAAAFVRRSTKFLAALRPGPTIWESVRSAVQALPAEFELVLVHDAARPLASPELFARVVRALDGADAVVPEVPVGDTVKLVEEGRVRETIPREGLAMVQTPQGFRRRALLAGWGEGVGPGTWTEPLSVVPALGLRLVTIPGEPGNVAVRTPEDRRLVEPRLAARLARPHGG